MRKCYLERDVCGEHVWYSEERNVIWNQTNRNWKIFTSFALTWKYAYKKKKQVKLMITWIPTKILFNCNYKAYRNKNLCCSCKNQSKAPLPMNENSCRLIKHGKHCMQSILCIKKQQIRTLDLWSRGWRMLDIMEGGMNEKKKQKKPQTNKK